MTNAWGITEAEYETARDREASTQYSQADRDDYYQLMRYYRGQVFMRDAAARAARRIRSVRRYHFDLVCPRCHKLSETIADRLIPAPRVNCGDCLMDNVEIVEMKILTSELLEGES